MSMSICVETEARAEPSCWTTEHWLSHCEGFRVFTPEGPIGYVEEVVEPCGDEPAVIVVRAGEAFSHRLTIPVEAIEGFDPAAERVLLAPLETFEPSDPVRQLRIPTTV